MRDVLNRLMESRASRLKRELLRALKDIPEAERWSDDDELIKILEENHKLRGWQLSPPPDTRDGNPR